MSANKSRARGSMLHRLGARASARVALRRGRDGRPAFPFLRARDKSRYLVLLYHRVNDERAAYFPGLPVEEFRRQMTLLLEQGPVLPLVDLIERAERGDVPPGASAVTFDDGYRDNVTEAFPVLRSLGVPATIFLATDSIERRTPIWHDRLFDAFTRATGTPADLAGTPLPMATEPERRDSLGRVLEAVRRLTPSEREAAIDRVLSSMGDPRTHEDRMMSWEEARELTRHGIDIGAHTATHAILSRMPVPEAEEEMKRSREIIERRVGRAPAILAYPNGTADDFTPAVKEGARRAGFRAALTTIWGVNDRATDPFELRRVGAWGPDPVLAFWRLAWYRFAT